MSYTRLCRANYGLLEIAMYGILAIGPCFIINCIFGRSELVAWIGAALGLFFVFCFYNILNDMDDIARKLDHEQHLRKTAEQSRDKYVADLKTAESLLSPEQLRVYHEKKTDRIAHEKYD